MCTVNLKPQVLIIIYMKVSFRRGLSFEQKRKQIFLSFSFYFIILILIWWHFEIYAQQIKCLHKRITLQFSAIRVPTGL